MSVVERLSLQQRCSRRRSGLQEGQRSVNNLRKNMKQNQEDSLRSSLMWRANRLKDKIMQQTNPYDYSISKLTFQTLNQVKRHKEQFQERTKTQIPSQQQQNTQYQLTKQLLKQQLLQKLQSCKNNYKKNISIIKSKRQRKYTSNQQLHAGQETKISIKEMLTTAKNRFKTQQEGKKYKNRNNSEIIHLKKPYQLLPFNFIQKNYLSPTISNKHIVENDDANADSSQLKKSSDFISSPSFSQMEIRNSPQHRINLTQMINLPNRLIKPQQFSSSKNKRKHYPSAYSNSNRKYLSNIDNNKLGSDRSIFVPIGRVVSKQENKKQQTIVQVSISPKKYIQNRANKLSADIIGEFAQIQFSQNGMNAENKTYLSPHKKLRTEPHIKSEHTQKNSNSLVTPKNTTKNRYQQLQQNPIMSPLQSQSESKKKLKTQQFLQQKSEIQKEQNQIHCFININDLKGGRDSGIKKAQLMMKSESSSGLRSILFNRRITQMSRKAIRNQVNQMTNGDINKVKEFLHSREKGSSSMYLDICGNPSKLHQSTKMSRVNKKSLNCQ